MRDASEYFAKTVLKVIAPDGSERVYQAGQVVRRLNQTDRWSDCLILGFSAPDKYGTVGVKMVRPFAYASCIGTTCPGGLFGHEDITVTMTDLVERFTVPGTEHPMVSGSVAPIDRPYTDEVLDLRPGAQK